MEGERRKKGIAAKTFKCGTLFINVEKRRRRRRQTCKAVVVLKLATKREQFVIALFNIAKIFKIN